MTAILGYWNLRGLGQPIRLLLEYTETPYTEKIYIANGDRAEWMKDKFSLGMDFPNLPYYFDGDHKITQSNAIVRHIARKTDLMPTTEANIIKVDVLENLIMDIKMSWITLVYSSHDSFEEKLPEYLNETMKSNFSAISKYLAHNQWFVSNKLTFVDFLMYEVIDTHRVLDPSCLKNLKNLQNFMDKFESLPAIKKYMNSSKFIKSPLNGPMAAFGGK